MRRTLHPAHQLPGIIARHRQLIFGLCPFHVVRQRHAVFHGQPSAMTLTAIFGGVLLPTRSIGSLTQGQGEYKKIATAYRFNQRPQWLGTQAIDFLFQSAPAITGGRSYVNA